MLAVVGLIWDQVSPSLRRVWVEIFVSFVICHDLTVTLLAEGVG